MKEKRRMKINFKNMWLFTDILESIKCMDIIQDISIYMYNYCIIA